MNKNTIIGLFIVMIGALVVFSTVLDLTPIKSNVNSEAASHSIDTSSIDQLTIDSSSVNIKLQPHDSDNISLKLMDSNNKIFDVSSNVKTTQDGDHLELTVDSPRKWYQIIHFVSYTLEISIPTDISIANIDVSSGNIVSNYLDLAELNLEASSGNITLEETAIVSLSAATSSGNIKLINADSKDEVSIEVKSGNITIEQLNTPNLELESKSGNVKAKDLVAEQLEASVLSGNITIKGEVEELDIEASSGNINVETSQITKDSKLQSKSGNIKLSLNEKPDSLMVTHDKNSGSTSISKSGFELLEQDKHSLSGVFGTGDTKLQVTTTSGNFTLN